MNEKMIEIQGVTKSFGELQVLKGIDLTIYKGEVVSIVGPSGAGKTTLLQIMSIGKAENCNPKHAAAFFFFFFHNQ